MKKGLKKFTCMTLMVGLVFSNMTTAFASENANNSNGEIDFELLTDGISEKQKLDALYSSIGVDLDKVLSFPVRENFQQAGESYFQEAMSAMPAVYSTADEGRTLEADRIAYAGKMANWSKSKNSSIADIGKETIYMYLSHYVDVREPLAASNGIGTNSNMSNIWAKYITQYDRDTYDLYLSKGTNKEKFKSLTDSMLFILSSKGTFADGVDFAKGLNPIISLQTVGLLTEGLITKSDGKNLFATYQKAYTSGESVEKTIELISEQLAPKQGIDNKTIAKQFVGLLMAPTLLTLFGMAMTFYTELGYNIIDRANFVSMRMYYNFRMIDRMDYKNSIG